MAKSKRMMETDNDGTQRQFYPVTHVSAVLGLNEIVAGGAPVLSINGKIGKVVLTKKDLGIDDGITLSQDEYNKLKQIMADYDDGKFERVRAGFDGMRGGKNG